MAKSFEKFGVDRLTIGRTAAIAELAIAAPEEYDQVEKGETVADFAKRCKEDGKEPEPGDLIEIFRKHWAVYVGDGKVVHLGAAGQGGDDIGLVYDGRVLKQNLKDVVQDDDWRVNNLLDGTDPPRPADDIVRDAGLLVDVKMGFKLEDVNCEQFATELRYGEPEGQQEVATAVRTARFALGVPGNDSDEQQRARESS
ncbi:phospholipase A and acyltransferase 3-like [Cololabis saira]|uniref:phospholipase A and acyltransferase 3-like n=1 Tax=Cololabis saira TaxID=129043 RepID=UPI002AD52284|nr:phospholipase A and acyltransferase 3-like [Cololabis saira]